MKPDIKGIAEVKILINHFYEKVRQDDVFGKLFAHIDWDTHLPVMYSFWDSTLFYTGSYSGNPIKVHEAFHKMHPLTATHFLRWKQLFVENVNDLFTGENAELAKQRALSIATVMQMKIIHPAKGDLL